jgi:16S rRNA (uracil1498-N3)-methyltransferase
MADKVPDAASRPPVFIAEPGSLRQDTVLLSGAEGRHAATVRRLRPGERADLIDGTGLVAECEVVASRPGELELTVLRRHAEPAPEPRICVVQAIVKGDRGEQAVETMTEVGVDTIVPWAAERCVASWGQTAGGPAGPPGGPPGARQPAPGRGPRALERWRSTAREAAKQSRRARVPEVTTPATGAAVAERIGRAARAVILDPGAGLRIGDLPLPARGEIVIIVGPEGGLSQAELDTFSAAGATAARLGPTVLRSATAGAAAAAVLLSRGNRW